MPETTDDILIRRKRALYRANHRGTKEMDILLGKFAVDKIDSMDHQSLETFESFITVPDRDLEGWIMRGKTKEVDQKYLSLIQDLRVFHGLTK